MPRSRFALSALLTAVLAFAPLVQPFAVYAESQQSAAEAAATVTPDPQASTQTEDTASSDTSDDAATETAEADEQPAAPQEATQEPAADEGEGEGAADAESSSDTPSSDLSMANSWRYEDGQIKAVGGPAENGPAYRATRVTLPSGATAWGIDVSYANGVIDWAKVKQAGVEFAIIRLGYGWGGDDDQFLRNVAGAQRNGIKFGVYLYSYAWDTESAKKEANWTLTVLKKAGLSPSDLALPVYYDIENTDKSGVPAGVDDNNKYRQITGGPAAFAAMAQAYCDAIKAQGYTPGVYTSTSWWETNLSSPVFNQWERWVAQWNVTNTYGGTYSMWQYTSRGSVAGISGNVDLNYSYDPRFARPDMSNMKTTASLSGGILNMGISGFPSEASNVAFSITSPSGAVTWHQASRRADGSWTATADTLRIFDRAGSYRVTAYGTFGFYTYDLTSASVQIDRPTPAVSLAARDGKLETTASGWNVNPSNVAFKVTSPGGGVRWYQATRSTNGSWSASIPAGADFGAYGSYESEAYATFGGKTESYGLARVNVASPKPATTASVDGGTLAARVSGWTLDPSNVAFRIVSPTGAERWYQARRQSDGSWTASVDSISDFGNVGSYTVTSFATFAGKTVSYGSDTAQVSAGDVRVTGSASASGADLTFAASGWGIAPSNAAFRLELPSGDVAWVQAYRQQDGSWTAQVQALSVYKQLGAYRATVYATFGGRTSQFGETAVARATMGDIRVSATAEDANLTFSVSGWDKAPSNVAFAVKLPTGATRWIQAVRRDDGSWAASGSATDTFGAWGTYRVSAYATFDGTTITVGGDTVEASAGPVKAFATVSNATDLSLSASGWWIDPKNVAFEVVLPSGASKWVQASRQESGAWAANVSVLRDLGEWGTYRIKVYATIGKLTSNLASTTATASLGSITVSSRITSGGNAFDVVIKGFNVTPSNLAFEIVLPQGGSKWIQGVRQADGSWAATGYAWQGYSVYGTYRVRTYISLSGSKPFVLPAETSFVFPPYIGYQNPAGYYQVSNQNVQVKNQGQGIFGYASPSRISYNATRNDLVNTLITRAMDYLGTPYKWDYSCAPGIGVDCAGLVMQGLYATGMELSPYNPWDHYYTPGHDQYANHMWNNPRFKRVSFGERKPGDLICYAGHISIYLGNDRVIEAYPPKVMISSVYARAGMKGVLRPFI